MTKVCFGFSRLWWIQRDEIFQRAKKIAEVGGVSWLNSELRVLQKQEGAAVLTVLNF